MNWIECVPNFSAGRDREVIGKIARSIGSVPGVVLLDQTADPDHNRSVFTFAAGPEALREAVLRAAEIAVREIDLTSHQGVHPRIGALDVVPLVPLEGSPAEECITLAHQLGESLWEHLGLPVYFYGSAARSEERRRLETLRGGGFEGLRDHLLRARPGGLDRRPDVGGPLLHETAGAVAVGVRKFLIAFNINLDTADLAIAKTIARQIRESSGGLPAVKALGLALPSRGITQVSINLTDFEITPPQVVFEQVREKAAGFGASVIECEIIGLVPGKVYQMIAGHSLPVRGFGPEMMLENRLAEESSEAGERRESGGGRASS